MLRYPRPIRKQSRRHDIYISMYIYIYECDQQRALKPPEYTPA